MADVLPPKDPVDPTPDAGGDGDVVPKEGTVSYESYKKLLDEKKRFQAKAAEFDAAEEKRKQKELESKGKYDTVLAQKEQENSQLKSELDTVKKRQLESRKLAHLLDAIDGDVDKKFYKYIDHIDEINVDPETGEVDEMSVSKAAKKFAAEYPEFIKTKKSGLPNDAPNGGPAGKISRIEWEKLPSKEMRKYKPEQIVN